ncbi:MAG TPA: pyridoxal phosphate-dependent aminotransferase [Bryobacteraceae bacterium]|nr:pyridoxal phosphate-dependent aminotransferase [Bryobacteraceae bacterium]
MQSPDADRLRQDFLKRGFTRRGFGRALSLFTAGAAIPLCNESALAQLSMIGPIPEGAVRINANENPLGPCREAAEAMRAVIADGGRYMYETGARFASALAETEGLPATYVLPFAGSSDPLYRAVAAFTSPARAFVTADPGYEAGELAARFLGARVHRVPLTKDYRHDVRAMAKADTSTGLLYVCSPNNPTGTVTPKDDVEWLIANKPEGSIVLLDEAYLHFASSATPATYLVAKDKDLIILRTFSKIYGMAGLRAGAALARPDLLDKLRRLGPGMLPITGMIGATTSLRISNLVPERRRFVKEIREDVFSFLDKHKFSFVPSESNKFMVDVKRPGGEIVAALAAESVYVGRVWPSWPTHIRVTVGMPDDMSKFKAAFLKVMA